MNTRTFCNESNTYLIDEENIPKHLSEISNYTWRTATCGELSKDHIGRIVTLCGWLEYHRMNKFIVLRDSYGQIQLILNRNVSE